MLTLSTSLSNPHGFLTADRINHLIEGGVKGVIDSVLPYIIAFIIFVVAAEIAIAVMERIIERLLPRIKIPFISSFLLTTVIVPALYLLQLIMLGMIMLAIAPVFVQFVHEHPPVSTLNWGEIIWSSLTQ